MSTSIFSELDVKFPDININLMNRSHGGMTGEMIMKLEPIIMEQKPDIINVYGDTNSTLAGALAASKLNVPIMHIEAGLRAFNKSMPEEINRVLTDHLSFYLFCPTVKSVLNLKSEGIIKNAFHVGDIMFDAVKLFRNRFKFPGALKLHPDKEIAVMTVHRAETLSEKHKLEKIIKFCKKFTDDYNVIFPVHPNTKNKIAIYDIDLGDILISEPLKYLEMQGLLSKSALVLTDSWGLAEGGLFPQM